MRDAIVAAVAEAADCAAVTAAHLAALTELTVEGLTSIRLGDLAGLGGLQALTLHGRGIDTLPVGLFDGLVSLESLDVRVGLTRLPRDIFRGLGRVRTLRLDGAGVPRNRIGAGGLPDGVFEPLSRRFKTPGGVRIFDNPGYDYDSLRPRAADAGPGGVLSAGETATLGGPGNDGGVWGSNVFYDWRQHPAGTVTLQGTDPSSRFDDNRQTSPNPTFTAPVVAQETELRLSLRLDAIEGPVSTPPIPRISTPNFFTTCTPRPPRRCTPSGRWRRRVWRWCRGRCRGTPTGAAKRSRWR